MQRLLALALAGRFNFETGRCDPSLDRLAEDVATDKATVARALKACEAAGWITIARGGGRGKSNAFAMTFRTSPEGIMAGRSSSPETVTATACSQETVASTNPLSGPETYGPDHPLEARNGDFQHEKGLVEINQTLNRTYNPPLSPQGQPERPEPAEPDCWHSQHRAKRHRQRGPSERHGADRPGPTPASQTGTPPRVFVKASSPQWAAWQLHRKASGLRGTPCQHRPELGGDGWWFDAPWPPNAAPSPAGQVLHA
jgi:hypothetical protein